MDSTQYWIDAPYERTFGYMIKYLLCELGNFDLKGLNLWKEDFKKEISLYKKRKDYSRSFLRTMEETLFCIQQEIDNFEE